MEMSEKVRENRLRRWAKRLGYRMERSRARKLHSNDFGEWMLVDAYTNTVVCGGRYDASLDGIEEQLSETQAALEKEAAGAVRGVAA
jgi:hypothetical protein